MSYGRISPYGKKRVSGTDGAMLTKPAKSAYRMEATQAGTADFYKFQILSKNLYLHT
ncbi:MAG: hypothetical protein HFI68_09430 [Lachnospiraceae bacterium]|nr:hypothetical protein [Lachnospiraceae bacterium]